METDLMVEYKYKSRQYSDDLVCELTNFMDKYLLYKPSLQYACTYLYNDLGVFSTDNLLQIAFRFPGATRGGILLKRLDYKRFEITGIHFNTDVCFGEFACYEKELKDAIDTYIGKVLNFSHVKLNNNI